MKEDVCHEERKAALQGYIGFRRQVWENPNHHKRPEMARATCREDAPKQFEVVSENGPRIFGNDRESLRRTTKTAKRYLAGTESGWTATNTRGCSVTDVRNFGATEMTIEYFDYAPNGVLAAKGDTR
jgi:endo-alpha-1,4-polygalactosaminidase (GH114 family)